MSNRRVEPLLFFAVLARLCPLQVLRNHNFFYGTPGPLLFLQVLRNHYFFYSTQEPLLLLQYWRVCAPLQVLRIPRNGSFHQSCGEQQHDGQDSGNQKSQQIRPWHPQYAFFFAVGHGIGSFELIVRPQLHKLCRRKEIE